MLAALEAPSTVLTLSNRFDFSTIAENMVYSDEDSDYSESSNEVNDENKNSPSHNVVVDVSTATYGSTNGREMNDGTIGVISKFRSEPHSNQPICPIVFSLIVVFLLFSLH
jgi:hypothetical protein